MSATGVQWWDSIGQERNSDCCLNPGSDVPLGKGSGDLCAVLNFASLDPDPGGEVCRTGWKLRLTAEYPPAWTLFQSPCLGTNWLLILKVASFPVGRKILLWWNTRTFYWEFVSFPLFENSVWNEKSAHSQLLACHFYENLRVKQKIAQTRA